MKRLTLLFTCFIISMGLAIAQNKQVSGTVFDENNDPIAGVSVIAKGATTIGSVTDAYGKYSFSVPQSVNRLIVKYLGYTDAEVEASTSTKVKLVPDTKALGEVVVTAMGITRSEKSIGYSATTVKGDEIASARNTNVLNSLSGKVAGLQITSTSTDPGTASNVIIRGYGAITGTNQPLYVVDGVPLQQSDLQIQGHAISMAGISNISPDDIESTTILKGAAATALYGSRAGNGVIIITTKKGKMNNINGVSKNWQIQYNGGIQARQVATLPMMQNEFGQGWNGQQTFIENGSWGPRFDGSMQVYGPVWNYQQTYHKYEALPTNVRDFFDTGLSTNHNILLSGVSNDNKMDYFMSYSNSSDNGIIPSDADTYKRNVLAFRGGYEPLDWIKVSTSVNFARYKTDIVGSYQGASVIDGLYEMPRDFALVDRKDLSSPFNTPEAYFTPYGITNPYWAIANNYNHTDGKQIYGKIEASIKPKFVKGLTLIYRYGFDYSDYDMKYIDPVIALDDALIDYGQEPNDYGYAPSNMNQAGFVYARYQKQYETNSDFLATYDKSFERISLTATAGVNVNERGSNYMYGQADGLSFNGFWDLSNGSAWTSLVEKQMKRRLIGLFGDVTLGYDDMIYLGLTGRNDWSSTLPINKNSYFYPGTTLSWLFTRLIPKNNVLTFGKVRLAYGRTGNDANPYLTNPNFLPGYSDGYYGLSIASFPMNSTNAFLASRTAGSNTLRPQMNTEEEVGLNMQFFNGRVGLDAAYYNRVASDQIFTLPVDPSTGYAYKVVNFGKVRNRGIELLLNLVPIKTHDFEWNLSVNFALNKNLVLSMPEGLEGGKSTIYSFSAGNTGVYMYAQAGKPLGTYYTYTAQKVGDDEKDKNSPYYGGLIVDKNGEPILNTELKDTGKDMNNKWTGGATTSFKYKDITLSAVLDVRYGGYMFSRTKDLMQFVGNGVITTYNDRNPFIIPNSVTRSTASDGSTVYTPNTTPIMLTNDTYQQYFDSYGGGEGGLSFLIDKTFAKVRNIELSYTLPASLMNKIKPFNEITVSAFVNNPFIWTAKKNYYIDPESSTVGTTATGVAADLTRMFGELYVNPACRIYGFNISVKL